MSTSPLIGVTTYRAEARWGRYWQAPAALLPEVYPVFLRAAGAVVVMLPPDPAPGAADVLAARLDALVLAGGEDVDPARYGQQPHPRAGAPSPERDAWELALLEAALRRDTPVLGICRGMQLMNVHAGGTLHQHLPDVVGHEGHNPQPGVFERHAVTAVPGSRLAGLLPGTAAVATHHHQGVDRLGTGLTAVAHAQDGTVEALEVAGARFALGVQWHPEMAGEQDVALVKALMDAARG